MGYVYDTETGLYYLQSRYYSPEIGRFINADDVDYLGIGANLAGYNLFVYCLNNPINFVDRNGRSPDAVLQSWMMSMWWLGGVDTLLPIGDLIYVGVGVVLWVIVLASSQRSTPQESTGETYASYGSPEPNKNDDDDDYDDYDDYYDDDSNFGGRQKIGKSKGNSPGNNQVQNKQFRDATRDLSPNQQRVLHDKITGEGLDFFEILEAKRAWFNTIIGAYDDWP